MKTFEKLFAAICLMTIVGLVGCGDAKKTDQPEKPATEANDHDEHDHDHENGTTPEQTKPGEASEIPTPDENPDVEKADDAESGSVENKGGVEIPE